jgi:hypothetical protein
MWCSSAACGSMMARSVCAEAPLKPSTSVGRSPMRVTNSASSKSARARNGVIRCIQKPATRLRYIGSFGSGSTRLFSSRLELLAMTGCSSMPSASRICRAEPLKPVCDSMLSSAPMVCSSRKSSNAASYAAERRSSSIRWLAALCSGSVGSPASRTLAVSASSRFHRRVNTSGALGTKAEGSATSMALIIRNG